MPALVAGIRLAFLVHQGVDGRDKPAHDGVENTVKTARRHNVARLATSFR
jgi:hypothetical protein